MNEELLYYIWQFKRWQGTLKTLSGEAVEVYSVGQRNNNAGPDFLHAKLRIGQVLWSGNVEIHVKTSDWFFHGHESDKNYQNLILHIVWQHDLEELPHDCPLLVLSDFVSKEIVNNYQKLKIDNSFISCENLFAEVDNFTKNTFLESLFVERFQNKTERLNQKLDKLSGDWEALTFERMAYVFGLKINAEAFELMAKSFNFKMLQQVVRKNESVEALLFGQSGFLEKPLDEYQLRLQQEYAFLQHKYKLIPIENNLFKFLRLRPSNFPSIRLAQLSAVYAKEDKLFQKILSVKNIKELTCIFKDIEVNPYWEKHYKFGKESKKQHSAQITRQLVEKIAINAVIPLQFLYGLKIGKDNSEQIIALARSIKPEKNSIIENYRHIEAEIKNAFESQGYLELYKTFCKPKKCVTCRIGNKIIKSC